MENISNIPEIQGKKRVVIAGGGFGGLKVARKLSDKYFQVVLLDRNNYHLFQPLLYQVATSAIEPSAISFPFRKIFRKRSDFHIRVCEIGKVIPEENTVETSVGKITYDYLVIATGCGTNFFGNNALQQNTMQLKTTAEALYNRNQVIGSFERALNSTDEEERQRELTFVIVGGGATGIELAGALAEMRRFVLPKDYPDLDVSRMRIVLLDASDRLLGAFAPDSSQRVEEYLEKMGVEICLKNSVTGYKDGTLTLGDGSTIETGNVFWVAGVKANGLPGFPADKYGRGNRLSVDEYSRVQGYGNVFAVGDTALMAGKEYPNGHPQVVQPAIQQAALLAENLTNLQRGRALKPFRYFNKGSMATIGRNRAVVEIGKARFGGMIAWMLWLFIHLMSIVGVKNRLFIFIDWMWSYITYDQSLRLWIKPEVKKKED